MKDAQCIMSTLLWCIVTTATICSEKDQKEQPAPAISSASSSTSLSPSQQDKTTFHIYPEQDHRLAQAVTEGNRFAALRWIQDGANPNTLANGTAPLKLAAQQGFTEIARILLDNKAAIDFQNPAQKTALH